MKRNEQKSRSNGKRFLPALFIIFVTLFQTAFAQNSAAGASAAGTLEGTVTLEIKTAGGSVHVMLPDDIRAGDTITGTVVEDIKTVEGEVVAVNGKDHSLSNGKLTFSVPQGASTIPLVLKSAAGKHIGSAVISINKNFSGNIPTQLGSFAPRLGQAGRNLSIPGSFDGNAANTSVNAGSRGLTVIAESPRQAVVGIPADAPVGPCGLTVKEGSGNSQTTKFNVVALQLKVDKLNLMKGETTSLHISVTGLEGLKDNSGNLKLRVENMTPQVVSLTSSPLYQSNGNAGAMPTRSVNTNGGNEMTFTEQLTGVAPGNFKINAILFSPPAGGNGGLDPAQVSLKDQLKAIADMKDSAANAINGNTKAIKKLKANAEKLRGWANDKTKWKEDGSPVDKEGLKKDLEDEKKELEEIKKTLSSSNAAAIAKIGEAIDAVDKALKDAAIKDGDK